MGRKEEDRQARREVNVSCARTAQQDWLPQVLDDIEQADNVVKKGREWLAELRAEAKNMRCKRNQFIREAISNGAGIHELARELGMSPSMICDISKGRR